MEIYSGKTLRPANLSNEYNRMLFLIFCFPENRPLEWKTDHMTCFPLIKCSEKNKMDNSQNGFSHGEKTGKIMKTNDIPLNSPTKLQQEMQKKVLNFPKFVRFLGHFLKKQCFWKMGVAGIKLSKPIQNSFIFRERQWGSTPESFI